MDIDAKYELFFFSAASTSWRACCVPCVGLVAVLLREENGGHILRMVVVWMWVCAICTLHCYHIRRIWEAACWPQGIYRWNATQKTKHEKGKRCSWVWNERVDRKLVRSYCAHEMMLGRSWEDPKGDISCSEHRNGAEIRYSTCSIWRSECSYSTFWHQSNING